MIDGLSGDQRFYAGWAQVWRGKTRTNDLVVLIKTDPHSPESIRGTVPEMNQPDILRCLSASSKATRCTCRRRCGSSLW